MRLKFTVCVLVGFFVFFSQICNVLAVPVIDTGNPPYEEWPQGSVENSVKVSNLKESGCTISWITDVPSSSRVDVYSDAAGTVPVQGSPFTTNYFGVSSTKHYVTIDSTTIVNAAAGTTFYFKVTSSDGTEDVAPSSGALYTFRKASGTPSPANTVAGVVYSDPGLTNPVNGVIVYINCTNRNSALLSIISGDPSVGVDGGWMFDTSAFRNMDGSLMTINAGDILVAEAWGAELGNATTGEYVYQAAGFEMLPDMVLTAVPLGAMVTPKPDLTISAASITFTPSSISLGESVLISVNVSNVGDDSASDVSVKYCEDVEDNVIGYGNVSIINSSETKTSSIIYTPQSGGMHEIYVYVDPANEIEETNENNNNASKSIFVIPSSNIAPVLTDGLVTPLSGNQTTVFTYSVNYTDADNNAPTVKEVIIDGNAYVMSSEDTNYTDGAIFKYQTTLSVGTHNYKFRFSDGLDVVNTSLTDGPVVTYLNHAPVLTNGVVLPSMGTVSTQFVYSVNYTDADNDVPVIMNVTIDGVEHTMTTQDNIYSDGSIFTYNTTLPEGTHTYSFKFSDGYDTVQTPVYTGPTVGQENAVPTLSNPSVSPTSGFDGALFTYTVTYTDADNTPPTIARVYIDGNTRTMSSNDGSYDDGSTFTYSTTLSAGTHNYYFEFSDGYWTVRLPESGTFVGPNVTINHVPSLLSPQVNPITGIEGASFTYQVIYQDEDNTTPTVKRVYIDGTPYTMMTSDSTYYDGSLFTYTTSSLNTGTHTYYFEFSDGVNTVTTTVLGGPTVYENTPPSLASGSVSPTSGISGTTFTYSVTYTDAENNTPTIKRVYIDGIAHDMATSDFTYADGSIFTVSKVITTTGNHQYYFLFSDGKTAVRLPAAGNFSGPQVEAQTYPPVLSACVVTPQSGDTSTSFTFSATYTDQENTAPAVRSVYIDGSPYLMTSTDNTYSDGAQFTYTTTLSAGVHEYYFLFSDGTYTVRYPETGSISGPTVSQIKHAPTLYQGGVSPQTGTTQTIFTFSIYYADLDNDAPSIKNVYIDGTAHAMSSTDTNYADGSLFTYSTTLTLGLGTHTFYFHFSDGTNEVREPASGSYSGPTVTQDSYAPTLYSASVSPSSGDTTTLFWFNVTYKDQDNDPPTVKKVVIDGLERIMATQDNVYSDGSVFSYPTTLSAGNHNYYFLFSDGKTNVRLPTSGTFSGPYVLQVNNPPVAKISTPSNGSTFTTIDNIAFNGSGSYDPEGDTLAYEWKDNGKTFGTSSSFVVRLSEGTHKIVLIVTDSGGKSSQAEITITVTKYNTEPEFSALIPYDNEVVVNNAITISWECIDYDSDYLTYDVYFDNYDASTLYIEGTDATSVYVSNLIDGMTYYWMVVANDGSCKVSSAKMSFKVNLTALPPSLQGPALTPTTAPFDGSVEVLITVTVKDVNNLPVVVTADLSSVGGKDNARLYDDGTHGDEFSKDNKYSLRFSPISNSEGSITITIKAVNSKGLGNSAQVTLILTSPAVEEEEEVKTQSLASYRGFIALLAVVLIVVFALVIKLRRDNAREAERIAEEERRRKAEEEGRRKKEEERRKREEAEKNPVKVKCPMCGTINEVKEIIRPYEFRCSKCEQKLKLSK